MNKHNSKKKIRYLWPFFVVIGVATIVLILSIVVIISSKKTSSVSDAQAEDASPSSPVSSAEITASPVVSSSPTISPSASSPTVSPVSSPKASSPASTASPSPTVKATATPAPTLEVVTVIDNTVHEYNDDSYSSADASSVDTSNAASQIIQLINQERNNNGLAGLSYDSTLASVAQVRLDEICTNFSHTRPDGSSCFTAYPPTYIYMGENLAQASGVISASDYAQGCVKYWMESSSHRDNILNSSYTNTAVAVCIYDGCMYAVQVFGTPMQ